MQEINFKEVNWKATHGYEPETAHIHISSFILI